MEKETMNCSNCGKKMSSGRENVKYDACGLNYVTLLNVEVRHCEACGESETVIPHIEELHRVIARTVAHMPVRLRGSEIRFLRKYLGYSGIDAAKALSVRPETMSRWERDKVEISPGADRYLRLLVANEKPAEYYPREELEAEREDKKPSPIMLSRNPDWRQATQR
jgi:putative transcriptional regulator